LKVVRVAKDQGGQGFVARDVCTVLGIVNVSDAVSGLDDDERGSIALTEGTSRAGGNPNVNIISESGLYKLTFKSRKPEAKEFKGHPRPGWGSVVCCQGRV
jgi:prophage antirepressor-like protein